MIPNIVFIKVLNVFIPVQLVLKSFLIDIKSLEY